MQGPLQSVAVQAAAGLAIGTIIFTDLGTAQQGKPSHHLAHGAARGTAGVKDLPKESPESEAHTINPLAAVDPLIGLGEQAGRQAGTEEWLQFLRGSSAELRLGFSQRGFGGVKPTKEFGSGKHRQVGIYICIITDT
jgi:hypothetical protein